MVDRRRRLIKLGMIGVGLIIVMVIVGLVLSRKSVLSPVPEDGAIKIIFISPTPTVKP